MRRLFVLVAVATVATGVVGIGSAAAKAKPPVNLNGTVNVKGTKDVSKSSRATLELEQDDYYFSPTFVKVKPGEKVTLTIKNEGAATHTFTSAMLKVKKTISPDSSTKVTVTIPSKGTAFPFQCDFHVSMGMRGAFFTRAST